MTFSYTFKKNFKNSNGHHDSSDCIPSPVPPRVESLRRSHVLLDAHDVASDKDDTKEEEERY